jgi:hypothetical protein
MGERKCVYEYMFLVGKPGVLRPLGTLRHRREDKIKVNYQEVVWRAWKGFLF